MALTENHVRLIRQRLFFLEKRDTDKADAIADYLAKSGLVLEDVAVKDLAPGLADRWEIPPSVKQVTVMVRDEERTLAREPIWRIPIDLKGRERSWAETCIEVPKELAEIVV